MQYNAQHYTIFVLPFDEHKKIIKVYPKHIKHYFSDEVDIKVINLIKFEEALYLEGENDINIKCNSLSLIISKRDKNIDFLKMKDEIHLDFIKLGNESRNELVKIKNNIGTLIGNLEIESRQRHEELKCHLFIDISFNIIIFLSLLVLLVIHFCSK